MDWTATARLHERRSIWEGLKLWTTLASVLGLLAAALAWFTDARTAGLTWTALSAIGLALLLRFFRDFTPEFVEEERAIVAPAHGVVDAIETVADDRWLGQKCWRISIYLSLRDVHVQNAPMKSQLRRREFIAGERRRAIHGDASQRNEALLLCFEGECPDRRIALKLIAGVFVRRIVPWIDVGDEVTRGQRISLIRFGSRADLYLPATAKIVAKIGDRMVGSKTILALWPE
jgi:phosphatidylserine decarboxylase